MIMKEAIGSLPVTRQELICDSILSFTIENRLQITYAWNDPKGEM